MRVALVIAFIVAVWVTYIWVLRQLDDVAAMLEDMEDETCDKLD